MPVVGRFIRFICREIAFFWLGIVLYEDLWLVSVKESSEDESVDAGDGVVLRGCRGIRYRGDNDVTVLFSFFFWKALYFSYTRYRKLKIYMLGSRRREGISST
jgi:hypothetical protein